VGLVAGVDDLEIEGMDVLVLSDGRRGNRAGDSSSVSPESGVLDL
jgi:hypothetical protein